MNQVAKIEESRAVAAPTPAQMLQIAVQQGADLDKLEKLMGLQERWEANEAKKAYVQAMSEFRKECPAIDRTRKGHNSKYSGLAETIEQIKPLLSKHGLSHAWKTEQSESGLITVKCCVTHILGHTECTSLSASGDTSGSKNSIQAIGSTISYLERYTLYAILGLASRDMDDDGQAAGGVEYVSKEDIEAIRKAMVVADVKESDFLEKVKVDSMELIDKRRYAGIMKSLQKKAQK